MAKTRVSELAKEFGITSKEMLSHLKDMKIPAKSASSALEDAYVSMVRKKLAPQLKAREEELRAAQEAEEAARRAEEEARRAAEEAARREVEERRQRERAEEERRRAEEEARRAAEEAKAAEEERRRAEEAERNRVKDTAPKSMPKFTSLLEQIAQQEEVLKQKKEEEAKRREEDKAKRASRPQERRGGGRQDRRGPAAMDVAPSPEKAAASNRHNKRHHGHEGPDEDRYSRMARSAEEYNRERVLEDARASVEEASRESTGRRKKRKEHRKAQAAQAAKEQAIQEALANDQDISKLDVVKVPQGATVAELADLLDIPASDIVKRLFLLGTPLTMTQSMSDELIELVADDLGREVKVMTKEEENSFTFYDDPADLLPRAPVVTVMGHVDHGKTSTLDAIRHTGVAEGEAGGITQHIGASQVKINGRTITFVDTPGHETFTAMRARGAKVTDIVVLVVAADDGVMPQTIESINHAKAAGVPIVVAVNKIDRDDANPDRVRQELTEYGVIPEEWRGSNMFVEVSAKKKLHIDDLLETIILQADVLELKANPDAEASGFVIEANLDKGHGPVATVLIQRGTLHTGDVVVAGTSYGRVRALVNPRGEHVGEARPADPVEILGLNSVPTAGDEFRVFEDERDARKLAEERALRARLAAQETKSHMSLDDLFSRIEDGKTTDLNLIVKADVQGSIEALRDAFEKMDQSEVRINIVHSAVGGITETDVTLAAASDAIIIGFNVRPTGKSRVQAEKEKVDIRLYRVIYQAIEDINAARVGLLSPDIVEVDTGIAEVRETFKVPKVGTIAGCYIVEGEINRDDKVRIVRDGTVIFEGHMASLRRFKDDVKNVKQGYECGIGIEKFQDLKVGDTIEGYQVKEVERTE